MDERRASPSSSSSEVEVEHSTREFVSRYGGEKRTVHQWTSRAAGAGAPAAILAVVHGYAVHCAFPTLRRAAATLAGDGTLAVFGLDLPGHGLSEGVRGYIPSPDAVLSDLSQFLEEVRRGFGDATTPLFLLGNSMGGAISLLHTVRAGSAAAKVDGVVLLSPMLSIPNVSYAAGAALAAVSYVGLGSVELPTVISGYKQGVSERSYKDPEVRAVCARDELGYNGNMRIGTASSCLAMCTSLQDSFEQMRTPFLAIMGDADVVVDPQEPRVMMERTVNVAPADKRLHMIEGGLHALLAEPVETRTRIVEEIREWIAARLQKR